MVIISVFLFSKPQSLFNSNFSENLLGYIGVIIALVGQFIRIITLGFTGKKTSGRGRVIKAFSLNTDGLYSVTRNPLYLGNLLITTGLAIIYDSFFCYIIVIGFWVFQYWFIILAEEDFLKQKFGKIYLDYLKKVPKLFPKFPKNLILFPRDKTFDWRYVLEREYNAFLSWIMLAIILEVYGDVYKKGYTNCKSEVLFWTICLILTMLLFLFFKTWKNGLIEIPNP